MHDRSLIGAGATRLLDLLRQREVSAREVVEAHIERIGEVNPVVNAIALPRFERALEEARAIDAGVLVGRERAPLAGLPVTVKECFDVDGLATTGGADDLRRRRQQAEATVVARLRKAGAVILGKTNLAQLSWALESENPVYGRTNNPWDPSRTPGGSSGGEGAIVAARGSVAGIGTDSGGSIRVPAHFCGIHGLKPTSGRLTDRGTVDETLFAFQSLVTNQAGVLAYRVDDLRLVYGLLRSRPTASLAVSGARGLRVGYYVRNEATGSEPSDAARDGVSRALAALEAEGAEIQEFRPLHVARAMEIFGIAFELDGGRLLREVIGDSALDWRLQAVLDAMPERPLTVAETSALKEEAAGLRRDVAHSVAERGLDVIVCPVTATPAPPHGVISREQHADQYTGFYNLLGWPAGVVAAGLADAEHVPGLSAVQTRRAGPPVRLPVGVQVVARRWREDLVLEVMGTIERGLDADQSYPRQPPI